MIDGKVFRAPNRVRCLDSLHPNVGVGKTVVNNKAPRPQKMLPIAGKRFNYYPEEWQL